MGQIVQQTTTQVEEQKPKIKDFIKIYKGEIAKALPNVMTPERFARIATTALTNNTKLANCDPQSFIGAMLQAAQLGLEPNTPLGQAYLIPYGTNCQFQIGYKGLMELAYRSGEIKNIEAHVVYENDDFDFEYGLNANLKHKPAKSNKGIPEWVYAVVHFNNGGYIFEVMSYEDCINHAKKYSKTFNNGPWQTETEEMAKKTVLKKALKYAPLKTEFVTADENTYKFNSDTSEFNIIPENDTPIETTGEVINSEQG